MVGMGIFERLAEMDFELVLGEEVGRPNFFFRSLMTEPDFCMISGAFSLLISDLVALDLAGLAMTLLLATGLWLGTSLT